MAKKKVQTIDVTTLDKDITINSKTKNTGIYFKNLNNFNDLTFEGADIGNDLTITVNGHKVVLKDYFAKNGKFPVKTITTDSTETPSVNILNYVNENYIKGVKQEIVNGMTKKINGTIFDDVISPLGNNQIINAGKGNDLIYADIGNDTMIGGLGTNEILYKYLKDPSELFPQKTFGKDTINLTKGETLYLNVKYDGNNSTNVALTYKKGTGKGANDLIIANQANENDSITIKNYYGKETGATVYINGKNLVTDTADFLAFDEDNVVKSKITGSALADVIDASDVEQQYKTVKKKGKKVQVETNLLISAGAGDDDITGSEFNDTITGGKGENTIHYNVESTFGHDVINLTKGETLNLNIKDNDIFVSDLSFKKGIGKGVNDLIISLEGDEKNSITIKNYYGKETGATVYINGKNLATDTADFLAFDEDNVVKSKITGSALADEIDATNVNQQYKTVKKKGKKVQVETNLLINAGAGNDNVIGSDFNDTINGGAGVDNLKGGAGNDTIKGGAGGDIITGGKGNDKLYGEAGENTFIFNAGDGNDTIYQGKGTDTLQFNDIELSTLKLEQGKKKNNKDLIVKYGENDSVTVKNYYTVNKKGKITGVNKKNSVKNITTNGANIVMGTPAAETFDGTEGRDIIFANGGNDVINPNIGDDIIYIGKGNTTLKINASMQVYDEDFGSWADNFKKTIYLQDKDSVLTIDFDKDLNSEGRYNGVFCRGSGLDRDLYISVDGGTSWCIRVKDYFDEEGNPRTNQVKLNIWEYPDIYAEDRVQVTYTVPEWADGSYWGRTFEIQPFGTYNAAIHGTNMPFEEIRTAYGNHDDVVYALGGDDSIYVYGGHNEIHTGEGKKVICMQKAQSNNEIYLGSNATTDTTIHMDEVHNITSATINNTTGDLNISWTSLVSDSSEATFTPTVRVDKWETKTSKAVISMAGGNGNDTLTAVDGAINILDGDNGNDILIGGTGVDTFNFKLSQGFGSDIVRNVNSDDVLQFENSSTTDIDSNTFKYYKNNDGKNLVISMKDLNNTENFVIIEDYFNSTDKIDKVVDYKPVTISSYNVICDNEPKSLATLIGDTTKLGNYDYINGAEANGTGNDDVLIATGGTNTITAGAGIDKLYSKDGVNTFVFNTGDRSDTLYQEGGSVTLKFNNANIEDLATKSGYEKSGYDLLIHYDGNSTLTVKDYYKSGNVVTKVIDSTGTEYNAADYFKNYITSTSYNVAYYPNSQFYKGTTGNDEIRAGSSGYMIIGDAGSDKIWGGSATENIYTYTYNYDTEFDTTDGVVDEVHAGGGNDSIFANSATNILYGDGGNDQYVIYNNLRNIISDSNGTGDYLNIQDTDYTDMHFVFNVDSQGNVDSDGLRILSDSDYAKWQVNTSDSTIKGTSVVKASDGTGSWDCIETFIDANDYELSMTQIDTVKGDIASWLSDEGYGSVSGVFGNALEKSAEDSAADIATLVAKFDSIQTKWS